MLVELTARHLLLASWEVPASRLARGLPAGLELALRDNGKALISVALLRHESVRVAGRRFPAFSQATVRTYVAGPAGPGIHLLSIRVGLGGLSGALLGIPVRPARIRVRDGLAEAPGLGFSFRYRQVAAPPSVPALEGIAAGDQQVVYFVSAGLRRISVEHRPFEWEQAELATPPHLEPVLALGFDVKDPDVVLYAAHGEFRFKLPAEKVK